MSVIADVGPDLQARGSPDRLASLVRRRSYGRVRNLRLELRAGGVVLRGQAQCYYVKQLAQQAVLEAGVLPLLANEIEVTHGEWDAPGPDAN
jgi:hypothetical protein